MPFPLHTVIPFHRAWYDATIKGQPVLGADLSPIGIGYNASVFSEDHRFHRFCRNYEEGRSFIISKLDGYMLELTELQQNAVDLLAKYGPFVVKKERDAITANTAIEYWHDDYNAKKLQAVVDKIEARANGKLAMARAGAAGPDKRLSIQLTDDQVAAGLRYLTGLDADRGRLDNHEGWSPTVSGKGHWACAMLDVDRAAAIYVAREFIGGYTRQMREGGII